MTKTNNSNYTTMTPLSSTYLIIGDDNNIRWSEWDVVNYVTDKERSIFETHFITLINKEVSLEEGLHQIQNDLFYGILKKDDNRYQLEYQRRTENNWSR